MKNKEKIAFVLLETPKKKIKRNKKEYLKRLLDPYPRTFFFIALRERARKKKEERREKEKH